MEPNLHNINPPAILHSFQHIFFLYAGKHFNCNQNYTKKMEKNITHAKHAIMEI